MSYHVSWLIENQVIYARYYGVVEMNDYVETGAIFAQMIESGTPPVHVLVEIMQGTKSPRDVSKIVEHLRGYQRSGVGWVMTITPNKLERFFAALVMHMFIGNLRAHMFASVNEIPAFLAERDDRFDQEHIAEAINRRPV